MVPTSPFCTALMTLLSPRTLLPAAAMISLANAQVSAQVTTPPQQGRIIVEQADRDRSDRPVFEAPQAEDFLTGEGDLILLDKVDLFFLRTDSQLNLTSNATLSDDGDADLYLVQEFSGGVRALLDEKIAVYAETGFNVRLYVDNDELNSSVAFLRSGASTRIGPDDGFIIGGDVSFDLIRDDFFGDDINDQVTLDAYIAKPIVVQGGALTITPRATGLVVFGDVSDFNKAEAIVGTDVAYRFLGEDVPQAIRNRLLVVGSASGFGRYYFDFFEEFTNETRTDFGLRGAGGLRYLFNDHISARAELGLAYQTSSVDQLDYFEAALSGGVWLEYRF